MDLTQLQSLENDLSTTHDYEGKKNEVADAVKSAFLGDKGPEPGDDDLVQHFLLRSYAKIDIDITDAENSRNDLEEAFYEHTGLALYQRYAGQTAEADALFTEAEELADLLADSFVSTQYTYLSGLTGTNLSKKLMCERSYETVNQLLASDPIEAVARIGTGLSLAGDVQDTKRELDLLGKCQYVLYESLQEKFPHVGLSLGRYLQTQAPEYEIARLWSSFHTGNIYIDLGNAAGDSQAAQSYFQSARNSYDVALDLALKHGFSYAIMTMYERLGVANKRLKNYNLAMQNYNDSLVMAESPDIKPWLTTKNRVRCLIGLGNVAFASAAAPDEEADYLAADEYYRQARQLANQVNYRVNEKIALLSLEKLYTEWGKTTEAGHYGTLAQAIPV